MTSFSVSNNCANCENHDFTEAVSNKLPRNFVAQTIMDPSAWRFLGVDLGKVEKASYREPKGKFEVTEDDLKILRFAQQTMMQRYEMMEKYSVLRYEDVPDFAVPDGKHTKLRLHVSPWTMQEMEDAETDKGSNGAVAVRIIGSIARLGAPAGVDLILPMAPSRYSFTDTQSNEDTF